MSSAAYASTPPLAITSDHSKNPAPWAYRTHLDAAVEDVIDRLRMSSTQIIRVRLRQPAGRLLAQIDPAVYRVRALAPSDREQLREDLAKLILAGLEQGDDRVRGKNKRKVHQILVRALTDAESHDLPDPDAAALELLNDLRPYLR